MLQMSAQQLAELLAGIARSQAALIQALENASPGTRSNHVMPALQNVAHLRDHPQPTLVDLPVRVLLNHMGRVGPDVAAIARDLERLLGGAPAPSPAAPAPASGCCRRASSATTPWASPAVPCCSSAGS